MDLVATLFALCPERAADVITAAMAAHHPEAYLSRAVANMRTDAWRHQMALANGTDLESRRAARAAAAAAVVLARKEAEESLKAVFLTAFERWPEKGHYLRAAAAVLIFGATGAEVAEAAGVSIACVYQRVRRGRVLVRPLVGDGPERDLLDHHAWA